MSLGVCIVLPTIYPVLANVKSLRFVGGAELRHTLVAKALARAGAQVSVIALDHGQSEGEMIDGVQVIKCHTPRGGLPIVRAVYPRLAKIWGALKRADADIYLQPGASYLTSVVADFARRRGRKSVFAGASDTDFLPNQLLIRYARDRWLYQRGIARVHGILTQTVKQRELCLLAYGRDAVVIANGYELPYTLPVNRGEYILWVGNLRPCKRPDRLFEIARNLPEQRFRMIGGAMAGETSYYESILGQVAQIRNLEFFGFVPHEEAERHFDQAKLLLNTSDFEGFPNTFLQAWARGVPTVSFFDPGISEAGVVDLVTSTQAAGVALRCLIGDRGFYEERSARCKAYFRNHHSLAVTTRKYLDFFSELSA
jgi:glycosyltransferase involved in cell wall biosynthesis